MREQDVVAQRMEIRKQFTPADAAEFFGILSCFSIHDAVVGPAGTDYPGKVQVTYHANLMEQAGIETDFSDMLTTRLRDAQAQKLKGLRQQLDDILNKIHDITDQEKGESTPWQ